MIELSPHSDIDEIGDQFWARIADSTLRVAGAGQTIWLGAIRYAEEDEVEAEEAVGRQGTLIKTLAYCDGTGVIWLDREEIVEVLEEMVRRGPESLDDREFALKAVTAIKRSVHEFTHLLASADRYRMEFLGSMDRMELEPIEEGFNESFSHDITGRVIREALPPEYSSRLLAVRRQSTLEELPPTPAGPTRLTRSRLPSAQSWISTACRSVAPRPRSIPSRRLPHSPR